MTDLSTCYGGTHQAKDDNTVYLFYSREAHQFSGATYVARTPDGNKIKYTIRTTDPEGKTLQRGDKEMVWSGPASQLRNMTIIYINSGPDLNAA